MPTMDVDLACRYECGMNVEDVQVDVDVDVDVVTGGISEASGN